MHSFHLDYSRMPAVARTAACSHKNQVIQFHTKTTWVFKTKNLNFFGSNYQSAFLACKFNTKNLPEFIESTYFSQNIFLI